MVNMNGPVKMASYDMAGKTAVVTGGTKGIGKAIALAFGQCGANVVVAGRHEDECTAVAEAITSAGGHGKGIRTDVRNIDEIDDLIAGAAETFGGVDILINCAGVAITKKILDLDVEDYDMIMETNLRSVLFASKAAAAVMKASEKYGFPTNSCGFSPHYFWQKRQKSYRGGVPAFPPGCSAKRQTRLSGDSKEETV